MVKVSKTLLEKFQSGCEYQAEMYRQFTQKKMSRPLLFGIEVHRYMEDGIPPIEHDGSFDGNVLAAEVALKMEQVMENNGYEIIATEVEHLAPLTEDIEVVGRIDALCYLDGVPVLVDYKTGGRQWEEMVTDQGEIIVPKAAGFQGPIYLTPPYSKKYFDSEWPIELHYVMVPNEGVTKIHRFYENDWSRQNMVKVAEQYRDAKAAGELPKNIGWLCKGCDWVKVCYGIKGWEKLHAERH